MRKNVRELSYQQFNRRILGYQQELLTFSTVFNNNSTETHKKIKVRY